jgi:DNA polymerase
MSTPVLHLDFESYSEIDLRKVGHFNYCAHPSTKVLCMAWAFDDGPLFAWSPFLKGMGIAPGVHINFATGKQVSFCEGFPQLVLDHVECGRPVSGWNVAFEHQVWNVVLPRTVRGAQKMRGSQLTDAMAQAAYHGLPLSLDQAAAALPIGVRKDRDGHSLMMRMTRPRTKAPMVTWWHQTDAQKLIRLMFYCAQDVVTERAVGNFLPVLPDREQRIWHMDFKANLKGITLDGVLADQMVKVARHEKIRLDHQMSIATSGAVRTTTQNAALVSWLAARGLKDPHGNLVPVTTVAKDQLPYLAALAERSGDLAAVAAIACREEAAKSSVAKVETMIRWAAKDQRMRGLTQYYGALRTGRWAGRGPQIQNNPRPTVKADVVKAIITYLRLLTGIPHTSPDALGEALQGFGLFWGLTPLDALKNALRGCLVAAGGRKLVSVDFAQIEARVLAWLAGEQWVLDAFTSGADLYRRQAGMIYAISEDAIDEFQRQVGKVVILACVAEGSPVLTLRGLVPIEEVLPADLLWDGEEWVEHGGVVCQGTREVWEYDGLVATEDHVVFTSEGEQRLDAAAARAARLVRSGDGRTPLRVGGSHQPGAEVHATELADAVCPDPLHGLRARAVDVLGFFAARSVEGVPAVLAPPQGSPLAGAPDDGSEAAMHEPEEQAFPAVWRTGNSIPLSDPDRGGALDHGEHRAAAGHGVGSRRQQRALRAGEPALRDQTATDGEPAEHENPRLDKLAQPVCGEHDEEVAAGGALARGDRGDGAAGGVGEAQGLARYRGKARVYDILNAGPRNRFTVSGVLVHNCGFQGGLGAFQTMADAYGIDTSILNVRGIIDAYRDANPNIRSFWYACEKAALTAVRNPGKVVMAVTRPMFPSATPEVSYACWKGHLLCKLPSGRVLWYREVELIPGNFGKEVVSYMGIDQYTRQWERISTYGGKLVENVVQATARDILADAMLGVEKLPGVDLLGSIHDEVLAEVTDESQYDAVLLEMLKVPRWAVGLPINADGYVGERFAK